MDRYERIKIFLKTENGKTVCICTKCTRCDDRSKCEPDVVTRDRFRGWKSIMTRDRYGR